MQAVAQNGHFENGDPGLQQRIEHWSKQTCPLFFLYLNLSLHVPSSHVQVDIVILGVSLIVLVLGFTWYHCAIPLQNTH